MEASIGRSNFDWRSNVESRDGQRRPVLEGRNAESFRRLPASTHQVCGAEMLPPAFTFKAITALVKCQMTSKTNVALSSATLFATSARTSPPIPGGQAACGSGLRAGACSLESASLCPIWREILPPLEAFDGLKIASAFFQVVAGWRPLRVFFFTI